MAYIVVSNARDCSRTDIDVPSGCGAQASSGFMKPQYVPASGCVGQELEDAAVLETEPTLTLDGTLDESC